jgi:hypothetical protein
MESFPWDWRMQYMDGPDYWRDIQPGFNDVLKLQPGAFPPGYRIANGQKGGGYPAAGATQNGTLPIAIQPPPSGTGRLKFLTMFKMVVRNNSLSIPGHYSFGLGVVWVSGPDRPMSPYLGVGHDLDVNQIPSDTIDPGETRTLMTFRLDIVDHDFAPVPGWPDWEMIPCPQNQLWPAVGCSFKNTGNTALWVGNVYIDAWSC